VTSDGFPLFPEVIIPENATSISIGQSGMVEAYLDGQSAPTQVGTIELARFSNPAGLKAIGHNLFAETPTTGAPTSGLPGENGFGALAQGYLEGSNVSIMEEMVNMIAGQRAYEINSKVIKTADDMLQMTNNLM
jgi:flagellar basal-body rod protein FlgG